MNFLQNLKPKAKLSKNVFDLSRKHVFSGKAGLLLPALCVETVPGDRFKIDITAIQRTMPMHTAAFLRGSFHYDFFFVPYAQLWHNFNQFIAQRADRKSVMYQSINYCPTFNVKDFISEVMQGSTYDTLVDVHELNTLANTQRLAELLGYFGRWDELSDSQTMAQDIAAIGNKYCNVFRIAAYQKIWYDYYRNKYYDIDKTSPHGQSSGGITPTDPSVGTYYQQYLKLWNFDDYECSSFANSHVELGRIMPMFTPRYVQWKKDLFTSALPNTQFGAVSSVSLDVNLDNYFSYSSTPDNYSLDLYTEGTGIKDGVSAPSKNSIGYTDADSPLSLVVPNFTSFDILKLRQAQALQKWKESTLRAGFGVHDNFRAHFGVAPKSEGNHDVAYLGSFQSALNVNSVEATASTGQTLNGQLGSLGANGVSLTNGRPIECSINDFGIIMCMAYFRPEAEYDAWATDKANTLYEQFDFFTPEFENLGLEAVSRYERFGLYDSDRDLEPLGYAPRYYMYKTAVDKVFGLFKQGGSLSPWVAPRESNYVTRLGDYYVSPSVLDNVFGINADPNQSTDYLLFNAFFDVKAIRPISVLGLPML